MSDFSNTLASMPSEALRAITRHTGAFDEQNVAAGRGPGKPGRHAGHARAHGDLALEAAGAEDGMQIGGIDLHVLHLAFGHAGGDMAADGADLALEIADAGFARVVLNDD